MAKKAAVEVVEEVEATPELVADEKIAPQFTADGVLLNPQDCEIGADGVVRAK
jgi:hypothetical protein